MPAMEQSPSGEGLGGEGLGGGGAAGGKVILSGWRVPTKTNRVQADRDLAPLPPPHDSTPLWPLALSEKAEKLKALASLIVGYTQVPTVGSLFIMAESSKSSRIVAATDVGLVKLISHMTPFCSKGMRIADSATTPEPGSGAARRPASCVCQRVAVTFG